MTHPQCLIDVVTHAHAQWASLCIVCGLPLDGTPARVGDTHLIMPVVVREGLPVGIHSTSKEGGLLFTGLWSSLCPRVSGAFGVSTRLV